MTATEETFADAARRELRNPQMRRNIGKATSTIRSRRAAAIAEVPEWEQLRDAGRQIKHHAVRHLADHLVELETTVTAAGGQVHWARDAAQACQLVAGLVLATGQRDVVKVKSMATEEIGLNDALAGAGITAHETDLAELIVQLAGDRPSHLLVPAIHRNRSEIREIFRAGLPGTEELSDDPQALAEAARRYLRERFLTARVAISGANFAVAETGTIGVVESEGNGRMCLTLPETLITVMGIEKVLPRLEDVSVMLRLLPRSATGERMNPYTSLWTGIHPDDGPKEFHLVLVDAGRTDALADPLGRDALHCIRCSACLNVCPVYGQTGGHAYNSPYAGPIGAILSPQLSGLRSSASLPWASSLCGACYEVCPVKIDIPSILVHLRGRINTEPGRRSTGGLGERIAMRAAAGAFASERSLRRGQWLLGGVSRLLARDGQITARLPGLRAWTMSRDLPAVPAMSFRRWWRNRR